MSGAVSIGVAAVAIGGAIAAEGATFAVIAAVGATVAAVGAVTKVKELQIAGAAIGVVGAVGGLASAAGAFGTGGVFGSGGTIFGGGAEAAVSSFGASGAGELGLANSGAAAGAADNLAGLGANASQADAAWAASQIGNAATDGGTWNSLGSIAKAAEGNVATTSPTIGSANGEEVNFSDVGGSDADAGVGGASGTKFSGTPEPRAPGTPILSQGSPAPTQAPAVTPAEAAQQVTGAANPWDGGIPGSADKAAAAVGKIGSVQVPGDDGSAWKDILDFAKKNDRLLAGVIQAGSSFLSGATNPLTPAQIAAMKAQEKANNAAAQKYQAETSMLQQTQANLSQPIPVASRITGAPIGMMNRGVTGVPA